MPHCLVCNEASLQMGADWTPDDLLWCGGVVCFGAMRQERGEREEDRGTGHQMPCSSLLSPAVLVGCHDALARSTLEHQEGEHRDREPVPQMLLFLCCTSALSNGALYHHSLK